jgi:hypothetical protein
LSSLTIAFPTVEFEGVDPERVAEFNRATGEMMDTLFWRPADNMFPLKAGGVLFIGPPDPANDPKFRLDVAFSQPEIVHAEPVLPTLTQFGQATEALIESFASLLNA